MNVRDVLPKRRVTPSKSPTGKKWSEHKPDLKEDFNSSCGYCDSFDLHKHTYFEVDHFVPKSLFEKNNNITYCQYDNLVYSCKFCNNFKSKKWPTDNELIHHQNNEGFIDPCSDDYEDHLYRTENGSILWKTELGKWMTTVAFKFDERNYSIKLLWNLKQLFLIVEELIDILSLEEKGSNEYKKIKLKTNELTYQYFIYHKRLMEFYDK